MKLSAIVAVGPSGEIGWKGGLPWPTLHKDLKWFAKVTKGKPLIMGRRTWESLPTHPLPGRLNIVVSSQPDLVMKKIEPGNFTLYDTVKVVPSLESAVVAAVESESDEAFVIGGALLYERAFPLLDTFFMTRVHPPFGQELKADRFCTYPLSLVGWRGWPCHDRVFKDGDYLIDFWRYDRIKAS